jgi:protein TonB
MSSSLKKVLVVAIVIALHVLVGYLLVSGMVRQERQTTLKPIEFVVIQEVASPQPAPQPAPARKVQGPPARRQPVAPPAQPVLNAVVPAPLVFNDPTPALVAILPSVPSAPSALVSPSAPTRLAGPKSAVMGLVCPQQVPPEMPLMALREGLEGVVKAQIRVLGGQIQGVEILSGPRVFHAAVKAAMLQYTCFAEGGEVVATQEFKFKFE